MRTTAITRVVGYARVSSEEQARGTSLQDQQDAIRQNAKTRGLTVSRIYVETESGIYEREERREQIRALMADVKPGDLVLCDKVDRWSRDPEFTYRTVRELREAGANVYFVGERIDPSTPEGDSMLGMRVFVAREEHRRIRERLIGTRNLMKDRGYYIEGAVPFGYRRRSVRSIAKHELEIVEADASLVRSAFRLAIGGHGIRVIGEKLRAKLPALTWGTHTISRMLLNRVYLGEVRTTAGEWIKGHHPAIIDADTFTRARRAVEARKLGGARPRDGSRTERWLLRGLARCARCGAVMGSAYGGGQPGGVYLRDYYRCAHRGKGCDAPLVRVLETDAQASAMILERLVDLREHLAREHERKPRLAVVDFTAERDRLQRRRERLLDLYSEGEMSRDELRTALGRVDVARLALDAKAAKAEAVSPLANREVRASLLREVDGVRRAWSKTSPAERQAMARMLITSIRVARDRAPEVEWRSADELAANVRA